MVLPPAAHRVSHPLSDHHQSSVALFHATSAHRLCLRPSELFPLPVAGTTFDARCSPAVELPQLRSMITASRAHFPRLEPPSTSELCSTVSVRHLEAGYSPSTRPLLSWPFPSPRHTVEPLGKPSPHALSRKSTTEVVGARCAPGSRSDSALSELPKESARPP